MMVLIPAMKTFSHFSRVYVSLSWDCFCTSVGLEALDVLYKYRYVSFKSCMEGIVSASFFHTALKYRMCPGCCDAIS